MNLFTLSHLIKKMMVTSTLVPVARRRRCSSCGGSGGGEGQAPKRARRAASAASRSQLQRRENRLPEEAAGSGLAMGDGCAGSAVGVVVEARRRVTWVVVMVIWAVLLIPSSDRRKSVKLPSLKGLFVSNANWTAGTQDMPGASGGEGGGNFGASPSGSGEGLGNTT